LSVAEGTVASTMALVGKNSNCVREVLGLNPLGIQAGLTKDFGSSQFFQI